MVRITGSIYVVVILPILGCIMQLSVTEQSIISIFIDSGVGGFSVCPKVQFLQKKVVSACLPCV